MENLTASLVLAVDSRDAVSAKANLDALAQQSTVTAERTDHLSLEADKFQEALKRQALTLNMTRSELAKFQAQQLGVADSAFTQKYIKQLEEAEAATGGFADRVEGRVGTMALRSGVHFALITVAIMGTIKSWEEYAQLGDKILDLENKIVISQAAHAVSSSKLAHSIEEEIRALASGKLGHEDALKAEQRTKALRDELLAQGPEYRKALADENMSWEDQLKVIKELNAEGLKHVNIQIAELEAVKAQRTELSFMEKASAVVRTIPQAIVMGRTASGALTERERLDQMEKEQKYNEEMNKLYKARADLEKSFTEPDKAPHGDKALNQAQAFVEKLEKEVQTWGEAKDSVNAYEAAHLKLNAAQKAHVEQLLATQAAQESIDADRKVFAEQEKKRASEREAEFQKETQRLITVYNSITDVNGETAKYQQYLQDVEALEKAGAIDAAEAGRARQEAWEKSTAAGREYAKLAAEADRMNEGAKDGTVEAQLSKLEKLRATGHLLDDTFNKAWLNIRKNGTDAFGEIYRVGSGMFSKLADGLTELEMTGKLDFKSLVNSMIADALRAMNQKAMMQLFDMAFSSALGGGSSGGDSLSGASAGSSSYFDGFGSAAGSSYSAPAASPQIAMPQITVHVDASGQKAPQVQTKGQGAGVDHYQLGQAVGQMVQEELIRQARPGGLVWKMAGGRA